MFLRHALAWLGVLALVIPAIACAGNSSDTPTPGESSPTAVGPAASPTSEPTPTSAAETPSPTGTPEPTASATPVADEGEEISFTSGPDTLYGTVLLPQATDGTVPGALIISGSGPTDRDGNNVQLQHMNTNRNIAEALAADGVASLRYDKLGSGKTGLASHADGQGIDFNLFIDEAKAAYAALAARPEIDPERLIVVGHSEGALFALLLAQQITGPETPKALVLAAPIGLRYMDILHNQIQAQVDAAVAAGQMPAEQGTAMMDELNAIIASLREQGTLPETIENPTLLQLFNPVNNDFLIQIDRYDPAEVAAELPADLPVLVLRGEKDSQVLASDVDHLMAGFERAGNTHAERFELPDVNHVFKVVPGQPNPAVDYNNPELPFSPEVVEHLSDFVGKTVLE